MMKADLVIDLGLHSGQDTAFYLEKGFRVVAVEANPELCERAEHDFRDAIRDGRLTLIHKAIARQAGPVTFYTNLDDSVWGTIDPDWAERNIRLGTRNKPITVQAITMEQLLQDVGVPYYLKIDIEGLDAAAVEALSSSPHRPKYISIESNKDSFKALRREIRIFTELGYDQFKLVNQEQVRMQVPPNPPLEGKYVNWRFEYGSSGLFGDEAPGKWLSDEQIIDAYKPIFLRYALTGDEKFISNRWIRAAMKRIGFRASWYDTHAKYAGQSSCS